jgi:excisionase family DNA binding protein
MRQAARALPAPLELLTCAEVAEILKLRPATVRRMAALGQIGYHRLNGKELRFAQADLDELLARTRIKAREGA